MDQSDYPVTITIPQEERSSRWLALAFLLFMIPKVILVIPHFVVLYVLNIVAFVVAVFAQFAVLFTGKYPSGMHNIVAGVLRWRLRVSAYFLGLTDSYPPFSLK